MPTECSAEHSVPPPSAWVQTGAPKVDVPRSNVDPEVKMHVPLDALPTATYVLGDDFLSRRAGPGVGRGSSDAVLVTPALACNRWRGLL